MPYVEASVRSKQLVAAAQAVLIRDGVGRLTMRAVAKEAGVLLGTVTYVFPSKEMLLRAVIEDVVAGIAEVLKSSADTGRGLEHAIRGGVQRFWTTLVEDQEGLQVIQYELVIYALRTPGLESMARWQYDRYARIVAAWCQEAASNAGESCAVPFDTLARVLVAAVDGVILQYVSDPDVTRAREDLQAVIQMVVSLASPIPAAGRRLGGRAG